MLHSLSAVRCPCIGVNNIRLPAKSPCQEYFCTVCSIQETSGATYNLFLLNVLDISVPMCLLVFCVCGRHYRSNAMQWFYYALASFSIPFLSLFCIVSWRPSWRHLIFLLSVLALDTIVLSARLRILSGMLVCYSVAITSALFHLVASLSVVDASTFCVPFYTQWSCNIL